MTLDINISTDFSITPGARYRTDGDFSGQEFFEEILEKKFLLVKDNKGFISINLDGTDGYATSFLDEAFGGLARKHGKEIVMSKLIFISDEEPYLIEEIKSYMNEAKN